MKKNIAEFFMASTDFVADRLFEVSVQDICDMEWGQGTPLPKDLIKFIDEVGSIRYGCSTYPFAMSADCGGYQWIEDTEPFKQTPKTYEDLVRPMCIWLWDIRDKREFDHTLHNLDEVWIEEISIGLSKDGNSIGCTMELGS